MGDLSLTPGLGRSPGEENGNPLQYACLKNPMDRGGAWWATVHRVAESDTTEQLHQRSDKSKKDGIQKLMHLFAWQRWSSCCCQVTSVVSDSLQPHGLQPTTFLHPQDFPGKNTGVDCHFFLQRIFPTEGSNPGLPHCKQTLYCLSHHLLLIYHFVSGCILSVLRHQGPELH